MNKLSLLVTSDGSHTIKNESTGDTYHSIHGAIQESQHVFIKNGLEYFCSSFPNQTDIRVLEMGFGTGLNAWLTCMSQTKLNVNIDYTTVEPFPLEAEIYEKLNYDREGEILKKMHGCQWDCQNQITPAFSITKLRSQLQSTSLPSGAFHVVYYDAFAPNSQPDLWTREIFEKIKLSMTAPSILVTYCSKGQVKRDLRSLGFLVESLNGPPGKREMVRARPL